MPRRTFDKLLSVGGLVIAAVLLVAGGLLFWAHSFVNDQVHTQLASQQIYFPAKGSSAISSPEISPYLTKYAGQQLVNGAQAEAYADHFIAVHLSEVANGATYAQLSSKAQADPNNTKLAGQVATMFKGETLRSMLLNAYAFWKMGQIALIAGIVSIVGAVLMLGLSGLGLWHSSRARETDTVFAPTKGSPVTA